jgi:cytochrome b pre-mRNA-processing protein 3
MVGLFRRTPSTETIRTLYGAIVAQARRPVFYTAYHVPDTVAGRFDMIALHAILLLRRVRGAADSLREVGQGVFDLFCRDLDHNLRERGVGDLAVPRQMRGLVEAFYGRAAAYDQALARSDDGELAAALGRNVFGVAGSPPPGAGPLASYVRAAEVDLARQDAAALHRGLLQFPVPEAILDEEATADLRSGDGVI